MPILKNTQNVNGNDITIYLESDRAFPQESHYDDLRVDAGKVIDAARDVFGDGLELAHSCAARVVESMKNIDKTIRPKEFEVQLSIKLDSEVGAVIAKLGAEAQMQVTMKWVQKD
jgi:hypothetical protein